MMAAYVIVEIEIIDPVGYEEYKKQAAATVHKYGGKYIARGGKTQVLEGDWKPKRRLSCFSSNRWNAPKNGSSAKSIASRAKCATKPPRRT